MEDIDQRILRLLLRDSRATYAEIGDAVGLSLSARPLVPLG